MLDDFEFSSIPELVDKLVQLNKRPYIILKYLERDLGIRWRFVPYNSFRLISLSTMKETVKVKVIIINSNI